MKDEPIVVVGAGIIGLLASWYALKEGRRVITIDRGSAGREASWAGAGVLTALYPSRYQTVAPLISHSLSAYAALVPVIEAVSGVSCQFQWSKLVLLDGDRIAARCKPPSYPSAQVRNPRLLKALISACKSAGAELWEKESVTRFDVQAGRLRGIFTERRYVKSTQCIVAAGAWSGLLLQQTGLALPIKPIRGQILMLAGPPGFLNSIMVNEYKYIVPRLDGRILVGSTVESVGFDKSTTQVEQDHLLEAAVGMVDELRRFPVESRWAGLRPGSPDDAPFIGAHGEIEGLFVCAGHYRNGFATAPASVQIVLDLMMGREPVIDPTPFGLNRATRAWSI